MKISIRHSEETCTYLGKPIGAGPVIDALKAQGHEVADYSDYDLLIDIRAIACPKCVCEDIHIVNWFKVLRKLIKTGVLSYDSSLHSVNTKIYEELSQLPVDINVKNQYEDLSLLIHKKYLELYD